MVTYKCNKKCPYCFAIEHIQEYPQEMSIENFKKALDWIGNRLVGIIGGEPTLHSHFEEILQEIEKRNGRMNLFTNGIFEEKKAQTIKNSNSINLIFLNLNPSTFYTEKEQAQIEKNLSVFSGNKLVLSVNLNPEINYEHVLRALKKFNVFGLRFDIPRPNHSKKNKFMNMGEIKEFVPKIIQFVKETRAINQNMLIDWDCCIPRCIFSEQQLDSLKEANVQLMHFCKGYFDINPDLSAFHCMGFSGVKIENILKFKNLDEAWHYLLEKTKPIREKTVLFEECGECVYFPETCQGGVPWIKGNKTKKI